MVLEHKEVTIYLSQQRLAEWAGVIADSSIKKSRDYQNKAERLRYYLKAIQYEFFLDEDELISILTCMEKLSEITDWPTAPLITSEVKPDLIISGSGPVGDQGPAGLDGTDANIDTVSGDNIIKVVTTIENGIKTNTITYNPYEILSLSIAIDSSSFPSVGTLIQELGRTVSYVPIIVNISKTSNAIDSSSFLGPGTLPGQYSSLLNLTSINAGTPQIISIVGDSVTTTTTYSVTADDLINQPVKAKTITFVIPFLTGSSSTLLTQSNAYAGLQKVIETKGTKVVTFNAIDSYFEFIYPVAHGPLSIIKDGNGFNATSAFIQTIENIDMINGTESMYRYRTIITDIPGQDYTFIF